MSKLANELKEKLKKQPRPHDEMIQSTTETINQPKPAQKRKPGRPKKMNIKPMTINMEEELFARFDEHVWKIRGNKSEIIRQLVQKWLEEQENKIK